MISGLAAKLSNGKQPLALPAPQADIRAQVRGLAEGMNGKTWKQVKTKLLAMLAGA